MSRSSKKPGWLQEVWGALYLSASIELDGEDPIIDEEDESYKGSLDLQEKEGLKTASRCHSHTHTHKVLKTNIKKKKNSLELSRLWGL